MYNIYNKQIIYILYTLLVGLAELLTELPSPTLLNLVNKMIVLCIMAAPCGVTDKAKSAITFKHPQSAAFERLQINVKSSR